MILQSLLVPLLALPAASAQLHELARKAGKQYFGTATDTAELSNSQYFDILTNTREFGQIVPSNGQKWQFVQPQPDTFNFTEGEIITSLAARTGQLLRCHNLVWHSQLAPWVEAATWDRTNMTAMLREHVFREAAHWRGQCYAWDVVNEGLEEDGTYRDTIFYRILGEDYLKIAFETAALADPGAKLYYNDYNVERLGPKAEGVRRIVKLIQDAGLRIDGVGMQSHFISGSTPSLDEQIATMKSYTELGVEVAQTEIDIRINLPLDDAKLEQQKQDYKNTIGACVQVRGCVGMTVWDFYDPFSWVPGVFEGQGAATLYFDDFSKHPAYDGVVEALTNKTRTCKPRKQRRGMGESKNLA